MSLAPSALVQLDSACELFSKAARGFGAEKVLVSPYIIVRCQSLTSLNAGDHVETTRKSAHQPVGA